MRTSLPLLRTALFSFLALGAPITIVAAQAPDDEPRLEVAALREDFSVLRRALAEAHGGYDRYATRAAVENSLDRHAARLDRPMRVTELAGVIAEAIAGLRDGHARLELDSVTATALANAPLIPVRVALEGERLVVVRSEVPGDSSLRAGMEILRIDGRPAAAIVRALRPKVSGDGFVETGKRRRLAREFPSLYWLYVDRPASGSFTIEARDALGRSVTTTLAGVRARSTAPDLLDAQLSARTVPLDGASGYVALELLEDSTVARLRIRGFDGQAFPAALDSAFARVRMLGVQRFVLDLRGNGGGVDEYGARLVGHFLDRPFRYFDRIHLPTIAPSFATWKERTFVQLREGTVRAPDGGHLVTAALHTGVGEQRPDSAPFRGRVVVLIDGGTFSTAADVAAQLRSTGRARFVGEETAGAYEGNTSGLNALIVLPHSRLRLRIMMYDYWNAVIPPAKRGRGTIPDATVTRRVADALRGDDPQLARALELLR